MLKGMRSQIKKAKNGTTEYQQADTAKVCNIKYVKIH